MEHHFWLDKWDKKQIGFHRDSVHPMLEGHISSFNLLKGSTIFLPLCGKTLDIPWLVFQGFHVVGCELAEVAVVELFQEMEVIPTITKVGGHKKYSTTGIDIFCGDLFLLTEKMIGHIDLIYDRASMVALPKEMRNEYTKLLPTLSKTSPILLITFDYPQELMNGPPFSISPEEIKEHYKGTYGISLLEKKETSGKLRDISGAYECAWKLKS